MKIKEYRSSKRLLKEKNENIHDLFFKDLLKELNKLKSIKYIKYDTRDNVYYNRYITFQVISLDSMEYQIYFTRNGTTLIIGNDRNNTTYYTYNFYEDLSDLSDNLKYFVKLVVSEIKRIFLLKEKTMKRRHFREDIEKYFEVEGKIYVDIHEDSYEEGELDLVNEYSFSYTRRAKSITEVLEYVTDYVCSGKKFDKDDWNIGLNGEGTVQGSFLVDEDNTYPSKSQIKDWKEGLIKLFSASVFFSITTVAGSYPTTEEEFNIEGIREQ